MEQKKGFTLIELLVVIAIMTVLPLVVVSDFPRIRLQFALSRAANTFAQNLRNTEDRSLSSTDFLDEFGAERAISSYGVYVDVNNLGNKKYVIYADAYPGNSYYDQLDYVIQTIDFSNDEPGIVIKEVVNTTNNMASITFIPPNPDVVIHELQDSNTSVNIVFAMEDDLTATKTVTINTAGLVEVQ